MMDLWNNELQVGDTRKEAMTRLEVQFFIKVAGVWDLQEEVRHCLAATLQEFHPVPSCATAIITSTAKYKQMNQVSCRIQT